MTYIAHIEHNRKLGRLVVSLDVSKGDNNFRLWVDGVIAPGQFVDSGLFGTLYLHIDNEWGLPGLGYGLHKVEVKYRTPAKIASQVAVADPPASNISGSAPRIWPPENLLPMLWDAGFRTETQMLNMFGIACGESGFYVKARNWLPSSGFRPQTDRIGVEGPAAAWNADHTQQGHSDRGLFQINSRYWGRFEDSRCDDAREACKVAYEMTNNGTNWQWWGKDGEGAAWYSRYWDAPVHGFPALRPLVQAFLAQKA